MTAPRDGKVMNFATLCSGINAPAVAWTPLGWQESFCAEIEPFPCALLRHYWPDVPNLGDMTAIKESDLEPYRGTIDVLCAGTPCQSFSVAGLRAGLDDARGNLALRFLQIAGYLRPRWLVWENVPGVFSSGSGRDFACIISGMEELGYGVVWRVLDAQHFGVPQRRRRVFAVGYFGDWRGACAVLLERHSMSGNPAPRREAREDVTGTLGSRATAGGGLGTDFDCSGGVVAPAVTAKWAKGSGGPAGFDECQNLITSTLTACGGQGGRRDKIPMIALGFRHSASIQDSNPVLTEQVPTLRKNDESGPSVYVFDPNQVTSSTNRSVPTPGLSHTLPAAGNAPICFEVGNLRRRCGAEPNEHTVPTLGSEKTGDAFPHIASRSGVRRLTPRECERLQGFPDDWTAIPFKGKPAADSPRYRAIGNSMAVPVMRWIGERIQVMEGVTV